MDVKRSYDSIPSRLLEQARTRPNEPAYFVREGSGMWSPTDWRTFVDEVQEAARALIALGLDRGDRVCILGFNRPEWVIFDVAAMMAGGVPTGIYTTCSPAEVQYIIDHAEASVVLIDDGSQWEKIKAERERLPRLKHVVTMKGVSVDDPLCITWADFVAKGDEVNQAVLGERLSQISGDDVGTLIYTSGTTGPPKAVMLSHDNLAWTAGCSQRLTDVRASDRVLSYLPLSHIAEQMFTIHIPITVGARVYYARSMDSLPDDLREVRPTVFLGVPRVWEKMRAKIQAGLDGASGLKAKLAAWAMATGKKAASFITSGEELSGLLRIQFDLAQKLVYSKVRDRLGFGDLRIAVTGAAPLSLDVLEFFAGLGIIIHEVYGQSENTGPVSFNTPGATRLGTVGKPLPDTQVVLADDGEIRVKGPHIFKGYLKSDQATQEALDGEWLLTGDLGAFDEAGYLKIVGRKKEIIITAGGKNVAPKNIEAALKDLPLVSQAVVIGERRPYISALLTLDSDAAAAFAKAHGLASPRVHDEPKLQEALHRQIDEKVNSQLARVEQVKRFRILPRDFSVEDGELTPSLKIKRRAVNAHFAEEIEALYR